MYLQGTHFWSHLLSNKAIAQRKREKKNSSHQGVITFLRYQKAQAFLIHKYSPVYLIFITAFLLKICPSSSTIHCSRFLVPHKNTDRLQSEHETWEAIFASCQLPKNPFPGTLFLKAWKHRFKAKRAKRLHSSWFHGFAAGHARR